MPRKQGVDLWLVITPLILLAGGLVILSSASHFVALRYNESSTYFLYRQTAHLLLGLLVMYGATMVPYKKLAEPRVFLPILVACIVGLVAVLFFREINGARRWIILGGFRLQPSEFVKIGIIILVARILARKEEMVNSFWTVQAPCAILIAPVVILIAIEPDLGTALIVLGTTAVLIFVAGIRWRTVLGATIVGMLALAPLILMEGYRVRRVVDFLSGAENYQGEQSMIALGSGGLLGVGLGKGQQHALFLPEAHTDFIFAVIGEQLGLIGTLVVLTAFLILLWRGVRTSLKSPDRFGFYLALGVTCLLVFQGFANMAVCVGLIPTTGIALPFVSYGGSSLLASMLALGLLVNVSQYSN
jgi:cell division protein FtsW